MSTGQVPSPATHGDHNSDPEPLAIATLCVGTLAMAGAVANAFVNYRKLVRDQKVRKQDATAEFLGHIDSLRAAGDRLLGIVAFVGEHGEAAFRMTHRPAGATDIVQAPVRTLRAGESSLDLEPKERGRWKELVAGAARGAVSMDDAISAYDEALSALLASGRRLELASAVSLESVIGNVVDHSMAFRKALDSYQNLRAGSPLAAAEIRFYRLRLATAAMVEAANGFASVTAMLIKAKQERG